MMNGSASRLDDGAHTYTPHTVRVCRCLILKEEGTVHETKRTWGEES